MINAESLAAMVGLLRLFFPGEQSMIRISRWAVEVAMDHIPGGWRAYVHARISAGFAVQVENWLAEATA